MITDTIMKEHRELTSLTPMMLRIREKSRHMPSVLSQKEADASWERAYRKYLEGVDESEMRGRYIPREVLSRRIGPDC